MIDMVLKREGVVNRTKHEPALRKKKAESAARRAGPAPDEKFSGLIKKCHNLRVYPERLGEGFFINIAGFL